MTQSEAVSQHILSLDAVSGEIIEYLRQVILETSPEISEHIKWNSPSFFYNGEIKPFDAKEYKRDIVVVNLHRGTILLVFPTGMKITTSSEIFERDFPDGRKIAKIESLDDAIFKRKALQDAITDWLSKVEKQ